MKKIEELIYLLAICPSTHPYWSPADTRQERLIVNAKLKNTSTNTFEFVFPPIKIQNKRRDGIEEVIVSSCSLPHHAFGEVWSNGTHRFVVLVGLMQKQAASPLILSSTNLLLPLVQIILELWLRDDEI